MILSEEPEVQHHRYSASGAAAWMACPGKLVMEQGIKEEDSNPAGEEGSAAHYLASECLLNNKNPPDYLKSEAKRS